MDKAEKTIETLDTASEFLKEYAKRLEQDGDKVNAEEAREVAERLADMSMELFHY